MSKYVVVSKNRVNATSNATTLARCKKIQKELALDFMNAETEIYKLVKITKRDKK